MRDPNRIKEMVEKLQEVWELYPDLRLGQLIAICAPYNIDPEKRMNHLFNMEDDHLLEKLNEILGAKGDDK